MIPHFAPLPLTVLCVLFRILVVTHDEEDTSTLNSRANGRPPDLATNLLSLVGVGNHPTSQPIYLPTNHTSNHRNDLPTVATTTTGAASSRTSRSLHDPLSFVVPGSWSCVRLTRFQWIQCRDRSYRIWKWEINECFSRPAARHHRSESGISVDSSLCRIK